MNSFEKSFGEIPSEEHQEQLETEKIEAMSPGVSAEGTESAAVPKGSEQKKEAEDLIGDEAAARLEGMMGKEKFKRFDELTKGFVHGQLSPDDLREYYTLCEGSDVHKLEEEHIKNRNMREEFEALMAKSDVLITALRNEIVEKNNGNRILEREPSGGEMEEIIANAMGRERFERFLSLNRVRELLGQQPLLGGVDEEFEKLKDEFSSIRREYIRKMVNTPPGSVELEQSVEAFNEDDVLKWKEDAKKFEDFSTRAHGAISPKEIEKNFFNPADVNCLKAVFLGEKPAVWLEKEIDPNGANYPEVVNLLESSGLKISAGFIYDEKQAKNVIEKNREIFQRFNSSNPVEIIRLAAAGNTKADSLAVGLLLGIPLESAKKFEPYKEGDSEPLGSRRVDVYGVAWEDFGDSLESKIKQARLKAAFELSGILETNFA